MPDDNRSIARTGTDVKSIARWITSNELILLLLAAPAMLFASRWSVVAAPVIPLVWISRRVSQGRYGAATPMDGALALLFLASLAGLIPSVAPDRSLARLWTLLLGLALFYALVNRLTTRREWLLAGDLLIAGGTGLALLALVGTDWAKVRLVDMSIYRPLSALAQWLPDSARINPRVAGMALAMLIPLAVGQAVSGDRGRRRLLAWSAAISMAVVLLLTQSLQAAFGLAVALLCLAAWRRRWVLLLVPLGLAAGAALLVWGPQKIAGTLLTPGNVLGDAVTLRLDMWSRALAMIRDMPFTGIGLDTFPLIQTGVYPGFYLGPEPHAHNLYLQVTLDLGVIGLAAFLWLVAVFFRSARMGLAHMMDPRRRALITGAASGVVVYLASGLVDTLWTAKPNLLFWMLLGLVAAGLPRAVAQPRARGRQRQWAFAALMVALAAAGVLLMPGVRHRNTGMIQAINALAENRDPSQANVKRMARAAAHLERAVATKPSSGTAFRTLGRLYGQVGRYPQAVEALEQGVRADGQSPLAQYAPWLLWARRIRDEDPSPACDDLLRVYSQWMARFPGHAEFYIQIAMVSATCRDDPAAARAVLGAGTAAHAEPAGLLTYYAEALRR